MPVSVRSATPADAGLIHQFILDLADYEKLLDTVQATEADTAAALFGDNPRAFADIAELDEVLDLIIVGKLNKQIADVLGISIKTVEVHRARVMEVLADAQMHKSGRNALPQLLEAGIPVAFETAYAAAHNKVLIVDAVGPGCAVATGSYNYTWSARNRNAENLIVLRDNCALAQLYLRNWQRHREAATELRSLPWEARPGASPDG